MEWFREGIRLVAQVERCVISINLNANVVPTPRMRNVAKKTQSLSLLYESCSKQDRLKMWNASSPTPVCSSNFAISPLFSVFFFELICFLLFSFFPLLAYDSSLWQGSYFFSTFLPLIDSTSFLYLSPFLLPVFLFTPAFLSWNYHKYLKFWGFECKTWYGILNVICLSQKLKYKFLVILIVSEIQY